MPEVKLKKLYMAKSMEALNDRVYVELQASPEKLLKSSKTILREAEKSDKDKDEELAYLYFMRYFSVVKNLRKIRSITHHFWIPKVIKKAIIRAEELSNSLQRRYDLLVIANESEKKTILKEAEKKEKEISKVPATFPVKETVISDGFITCEKLYSLTKEKVSSFLVIDIRSKEDFAMSSMKISTLINIPEDILKPGVTANKAGRDLDEGSRLLWGRRHTYDYIIICDYGTDSLPLTPAIVVLIDAMAMWDPGKPYRAKPCVLKGGYEMFCHTYPMLISNPRSTISSTFNSLSNCNSSLLSENFSNLNISFPDLNEGFLNTPSPTEKFLYSDTSDIQPVIPQVNRNLKPKAISHYTESKREDSQDLNHSPTSSVNDLQSVNLSTGKSFPDGVLSNTIPPTASYNHVPTNRAYGAWYSSSSSSEDENPVRRNEDYKKPVV
ncbi:hypothetical protein Anas_03946 [Armadillidium nasatum]|uniref:USP8 dimerisation domain-containing protein n=1 Tax=Armadillidium nasatum TaxID=96803 RepID=A0A5N5SIF5_9CRUS|nr:hypothetical protein Anas_03946 [Armadillidium nasatum]